MVDQFGLRTERTSICGVEIELFRKEGAGGTPLLFLQPASGFWPNHACIGLLSEQKDFLAPSHPGFGQTSLPDWLEPVD